MEWLANPQSWIALLTLTALEIVLGIDNIIFISILSGKLPENQQDRARNLGLLLAMYDHGSGGRATRLDPCDMAQVVALLLDAPRVVFDEVPGTHVLGLLLQPAQFQLRRDLVHHRDVTGQVRRECGQGAARPGRPLSKWSATGWPRWLGRHRGILWARHRERPR